MKTRFAANIAPALVLLVVLVLSATSVVVLVATRHLGRPNGTAASGARTQSPGPIAKEYGGYDLQLSAPSAGVVWALYHPDLTYRATDQVKLYRSTTQGSTWQGSPVPPDFGVHPRVSFINDHEGWLLAPGYASPDCQQADAVIWHTSDATASWHKLTATGIAPSQCKSYIWFADSMRGFVGAWDDAHPVTIYRTSDGGQTWAASKLLPDPPNFQSGQGGVGYRVSWMKLFGSTFYLGALGTPYVYRSSDGGASWKWFTKVSSPAVVMVTETRWLDFTSPSAFESTNGGQQFHQYASDISAVDPNATQFAFADANVGYGVSSAGVLLRTLNGGAHWERLPAPSDVVVPAPTASPASSARTNPACLSSPPPAETWQTYSDKQFGFSISYPRGYTFDQQGSFPGFLATFRAVDNCYLAGYPGAQAELAVYTKDVDPLSTWVQVHSRTHCADAGGYFHDVTGLKSTFAAGRDAVTFDMDLSGCPEAGNGVAHVTVFMLRSGQVFSFDWFSFDPGYTLTMQSIAQQMLASFKD